MIEFLFQKIQRHACRRSVAVAWTAAAALWLTPCSLIHADRGPLQKISRQTRATTLPVSTAVFTSFQNTNELDYHISTGEAFYLGQALVTDGHSGRLQGRDNMAMEKFKNLGPLPRGKYKIEWPEKSWLGDDTMRLIPIEGTDTFGRRGFYIHRQQSRLGTHGCIGLPQAEVYRIAELRRRNPNLILSAGP